MLTFVSITFKRKDLVSRGDRRLPVLIFLSLHCTVSLNISQFTKEHLFTVTIFMTHLQQFISILIICNYACGVFTPRPAFFFSFLFSRSICNPLCSCIWTHCLEFCIWLPAFYYSMVINQVSYSRFVFLGLSHLLGFLSHEELHNIITFVCVVCDFANKSCLGLSVCLLQNDTWISRDEKVNL